MWARVIFWEKYGGANFFWDNYGGAVRSGIKKYQPLSKTHSYWHQVQGEIYAANVLWADFVVWTKKELKILRVLKDETWKSTNIPKLSDFYINVLLPTCYTSD